MNILKLTPTSFIFTLLFFSSYLSIAQNCADSSGDIWVITTDDEGFGSLRAAIECANNSPGPNTIKFNIPGAGDHRIYVGSTTDEKLPPINDAGTIIDGSTQGDFGTNDDFTPRIILDGIIPAWTAPINAIFVLADNCAIYSLEIANFPDDGIDIFQADNVQIGAPNKGNIIYNCGWEQDVFPGISGFWNGCGIVIRRGATNCKVIGNIIGTNESFTAGLGNEYCGIINRQSANNTIIGGQSPGEANIIAFNETAILLDNSVNVQVQQNSLYCNTITGLRLVDNANFNKLAPTISTANTDVISGTGNSGDIIEVFVSDDTGCSNVPCQGKTFLGRVVVNNGSWNLSGSPFAGGVNLSGGEIITATATDLNRNTSAFSDCTIAVNTSSCAENNGDIWVTNTNDDGSGSLRSAINCANSTTGANHIKFNILGPGPHRIFVGSTTGQALPQLSDDRTTIDGTTQSGFGSGGNYAPRIILDGSQHDWQKVINAVWIRGNFCEVYALEVVNFPDDGIDVTVGDFAIIGGINKGNVIYNCGSEVDFFPLTNGGPWEGCAIVLKSGASNCIVRGNILGTNYNQNLTIGNEYCGIVIQHGGDNNIIGGTQSGQGNIIAHNQVGIRVSENSFNTHIEGNSFYCNDDEGIELRGNANNSHPKPIILSASTNTISGVSNANDRIEIFAYDNSGCTNSPCQGKVFVGRTIASNNGNWELNTPFSNNIESNDVVTATAADLLGNTSVFADCFSIRPSCALNATVSNVINASCDRDNGSFIVNVDNGSGFYTYNIGEGSSLNSNFNGLSPGSYSVTVSDNSGCSTITGVTISSSNSPSVNVINQEDATCDFSTGSFTLAAFGGAGPYRYDIGNGPTTNSSFNNLSEGTYNVTITDNNNCSVNTTVNIGSTPPPLATISNIFHATCVQDNGSFTVGVSGGTSPFTYNIGDGQRPNNTFSGLTPAPYFVTVTDANNCISIIQTVINGSTPPVAEVTSITDASCNAENGGFTLDVSGGVAPYSFDAGLGSSNSPNFSGLSPGTYTVTITDANDCEDIEGITIGNTSLPRGEISNAVSPTCGQSNGSFRISIFGGTPPYTYDYGSGPFGDNLVSGITAGLYTVSVTDDNGCTDVFGFNIPDAPPPVGRIENLTDAGCDGVNGSFTVGVNGGSPPYNYNIGTGVSDSPTFEDLLPGNYNLTITDADECTSNLVLSIGGSTPPEINIESVENSSCGQNNGTFTIAVSVGFPPYSFDIGNGATTSPNFTNLMPGNYIATVTDANGCSAMENVTVSDSPGPSAAIENIEHVSCGGTSGSFEVQVTGGSTPYSYDMGNGPVTEPNFTALSAGTYTISISDAAGCEITQTATINETEGPSAEIINQNNVTCGNTSGSFTVQASGGTSPYSYDIGSGNTANPIFSDLTPGDYSVSVNDANNCETVISTTLTGSTSLDASFVSVSNPTCGNNNGSFSILVEGGAPPFTYNIGLGNSSSADFSNLFPGTYTVTVTDEGGCSGTRGVSLIDSGFAPTASFSITRDDLTITLNNTTIDANVYSWTFGDGNSSTDENPVHTFTGDGEYTVCLNVAGDCGSDVACEPVNIGVGVSDPKATIAGMITTETGQAVDLVKISCTDQNAFTTDVTGAYQYENLPANSSYVVSPEKNINLLNGVSTFDLFKINSHVLAEEILDSPYKIIAADVNNSGSVSGFDIIQLRKVILGLNTEFPNNNSWRFIPADFEFPDPTNPLGTLFPESVTIDLAQDATNTHFIGIKIGDVNENVRQGELLRPEDRNQAIFQLQTEDKYLQKGEVYDLTISSEDLKDILGFQFTMTWDKEQLEVLDIQARTHPSFNTDNLGLNFLNQGILTASWFDNRMESPSNSSDLFTLKLRAKTAMQLSDILNINSSITQQEAYRQQGGNPTLENVNLDFSPVAETDKLLVHQVSPNPFQGSTTLHFSLPTTELVTLTVFDATGRMLSTYQHEFEAGQQQFQIDEKDLKGYQGVLFYQLRSGNEMVSGKVLRL